MTEVFPGDTKTQAEHFDWYYVRATHPSLNKRVMFRSTSERRARQFVMNRYPRGSEAYIEKPDGTFEHYEHERQGDYGSDADQWMDFDPSTWVPTDTQAPPGENAWSDKEG